MIKKSFKFNPNFCLIHLNEEGKCCECVFDHWSIDHFYWQGFIYIIIHHFLRLKKIKHMMILTGILTFLHIIEEYLGNTQKISLEGIIADYIGPLIDNRIDPSLREIDNDYLDNSIGDVFSGFISCVLIILYWIKFKRLPYFYLIFVIIIVYILFRYKIPKVYKKIN